MTKAGNLSHSAARLGRRSFLTLSGAALLPPGLGQAQSTPREAEGGIGGTGIVGLVTEVGVLSVAGNRLTVDSETRFSDPFGAVSAADITLGDSITVEAAGAEGARVARRVHVTYPLVGVVRAVSGRRFEVNGVPVTARTGIVSPPEGARVAVSGLWRGSSVVASRLTPAGSNDDLIAGDVTRRIGQSFVGPVRVLGQNIGRAADGSFASVRGRYDPDTKRFRVTQFENSRFVGAAGPLKRLAVEGYLEPSDKAPGYRISGLGHSFARNLDLSGFVGGKTLFTGAYTGLFDARRGIALPESFDAQRRLLRRIAG
ncbi:MAG: DUF5666 domain-containing protein [Pseudomonadota bacterium]